MTTTTSDYPVLVGMNNPISQRPEHALYPAPAGCAGHRLWSVLHEETGCGLRAYLEAFERVNVLVGSWDRSRAREAARGLRSRLAGRTILLLGREVHRAFEAPTDVELLDCYWEGETVLYLLPHPSGRNLWYNKESNRRLVGALLGRLYRQARGESVS